MSQSPASRRAVRTAMVAALVPLALVLGACASSGSGSGTTPVAAQSRNGSGSGGGSGAGNGSGGPGQGGRSFPGASGLIAAASAGTLQVQSTDSQTTVTYKGSTRFSQVVAATLAVGDCVMVTGTPATGSTTDVTATSVRVEAKVDGACPTATGRGNGGGFGGGAGNGGNGNGGNGFPNGFPSGGPNGPGGTAQPRPSGAPSGAFGGRDFAFVTGSVTAVQGGTVSVQGILRTPRSFGTSASPSPQSTSPTSITVTLGSDATVTKTVAATSKAAVVGMCATAIGSADDRGDIAATSITVSKPDAANGCRATGGFGFFRGGGASG